MQYIHHIRETVHRPRTEKVYEIHSSEYLTKSVSIKTECWKHQSNLPHFRLITSYKNVGGYAVAQLVEALRYKPEGRGFDSRWCHWIFSLT
jgi:hypothetical protein